MNNSIRGLFRYTIVISIFTPFSLLSISINYVPVFAQTSEEDWNSFTLQRINLRETPSIRSTILTVLDEEIVLKKYPNGCVLLPLKTIQGGYSAIMLFRVFYWAGFPELHLLFFNQE